MEDCLANSWWRQAQAQVKYAADCAAGVIEMLWRLPKQAIRAWKPSNRKTHWQFCKRLIADVVTKGGTTSY